MSSKINPKNIAILRTDRIGEVLLSTVAIDAVKRYYPEVNIIFVTSSDARPIVEDRGDIAEIITANTIHKGRLLKDAFKLAGVLRKKRFDIAIVLNPHKMLHLACFLAGIPCRVGFDRKWSFLLNRKIKDERDKGKKHEIEYTLELVRLIGINTKAFAPHLVINKQAEHDVERILTGAANKPFIAVHPGTSNPAKMWPFEKYAELLCRIKKEIDCNIAIIGIKEEGLLADRIIEIAGPDIINLTGKFNLKELAAFLKRCSLFIGNDTGPMHMAAALDVPVIAIFGRNLPGTSPRRWGPWGTGHIVFCEDPGCNSCYDAACPYEYKCLRAISSDAVLDAAKRILTND